MALEKTQKKLRAKIEAELENEESIIWIDMPIPKYFNFPWKSTFLFYIPWTVFAVFFVSNGGLLLGAFGIPFLLIGLWGLSAPIRAYRSALRTIHAITNLRVITIEGGISTKISSYTPDKLVGIYRLEHKDGTGDVIFSRESWSNPEGGTQTTEIGFSNIKRAKEVEKILKSLAKVKLEEEKYK